MSTPSGDAPGPPDGPDAPQPEGLGIDDLAWDEGLEARPRPRELARPLVAVLSSLTVVLALVLLPATLVLGGTAQRLVAQWEGIDADLPSIVAKQRTVLLDRDGRRWGQLFTENRVATGLDEISPHVVDALLATEDSRFYEHGALDVRGLARAIVNNVASADLQGASTLSQQLVENLRLLAATTDEQRAEAKAGSLAGKVAELKLATELERAHTKDEILEAYLNVIYLGNGAYGVEAAARRYFSTSALDLSVDQAATLVALLKSPTRYDPVDRPGRSRQRRDVVMARMVDQGHLTRAAYERLRERPTRLEESRPRSGCAASEFPYYCALVIEHVLSSPEFGRTRDERRELLSTGGLRIRTALDPEAMRAAEAAADGGFGRENRVAAGVAVMRPGTGEVVAIAQNRTFGTPKNAADHAQTEVVYADRRFQTGSTFKPLTLAAALEQGMSARTTFDTPNGIYLDELDEPEGGFKNDDRAGHGVMDAYQATRSSTNTYFVQLLADVGVKQTAAVARRLGLEGIPRDLTGREGSLTLGAYESSPLELATAYATLAARGVRCDPVVVLAATNVATGERLPVPDGSCHQAISSAVALQVSDVLLAPFDAGGTAQAVRLAGRRAAGKTGTTDDNAAVWFAGYTPQYATAVWVGDPRGGQAHPLTGVWAHGYVHSVLYGGSGAGPVWRRTMDALHEGLEPAWFPPVEGAGATLVNRSVPSVVGLGVDEAATLLAEAGFEVRVRRRTAEPGHLPPDVVAGQAPDAGSAAGPEDAVTLTLTSGSRTDLDLSGLEDPEGADRPARGGSR